MKLYFSRLSNHLSSFSNATNVSKIVHERISNLNNRRLFDNTIPDYGTPKNLRLNYDLFLQSNK